jgi:hypothetical protein
MFHGPAVDGVGYLVPDPKTIRLVPWTREQMELRSTVKAELRQRLVELRPTEPIVKTARKADLIERILQAQKAVPERPLNELLLPQQGTLQLSELFPCF